MRICLISPETFGYGVYGGFGAVTQSLARGFMGRGHDVFVVTPRAKGQPASCESRGYLELSHPGSGYDRREDALKHADLYRSTNADIYQSIEPTIGTVVACAAAPAKKHVISFQAPAAVVDWRKQWAGKGVSREDGLRFFHRYMSDIRPAVWQADAVSCQAQTAVRKCMRIYRLRREPDWIPNPVDAPTSTTTKSRTPTVCFLGRWDPVKRPEIFLELASRLPDVRFVCMGQANEDFRGLDGELRRRYGSRPNIRLTGAVFGDEKNRLLSESWILVNTSTTEGMPVSFLEAAARGCAIVSYVDADRFATRFGVHVENDSVDDFVAGVQWLLEENRWVERGRRAREEIDKYYRSDLVLDRYLSLYERLLDDPGQ